MLRRCCLLLMMFLLDALLCGCPRRCDNDQVATSDGCLQSCNNSRDCLAAEACTDGVCRPQTGGSSSSGGGTSAPVSSSSASLGGSSSSRPPSSAAGSSVMTSSSGAGHSTSSTSTPSGSSSTSGSASSSSAIPLLPVCGPAACISPNGPCGGSECFGSPLNADISITDTRTINTCGELLTASGNAVLTTFGNGTPPPVGSLLLVIQMQDVVVDVGVPGPLDSLGMAGVYELVRLAETPPTGGWLVTPPLTREYSANTGTKQVCVVPEYGHVTVTNRGTLTAPAWDGKTGGVLALRAHTLTVEAGGKLDVSGQGFRGGRVNVASDIQLQGVTDLVTAQGSGRGAGKGEGVDVRSLATEGRGNQANAGGGGNAKNAGGGGGGNGGAGGVGGRQSSGTTDESVATWGLGGAAISRTALEAPVLGGGGGAGHQDSNAPGPGGAGGGVILVMAQTVAGGGSLLANGAHGGSSPAVATTGDGAGGGGAGGSVVVVAASSTFVGVVSAAGGGGGNVEIPSGSVVRRGPGGGGGGGRVALMGTGPGATWSADVHAGAAGSNLLTAPDAWGAADGGAGTLAP